MEAAREGRRGVARWRTTVVGAAVLSALIGTWWTATFSVLSDFPSGTHWKDLWLIALSCFVPGLQVTGLAMLFVISPMRRDEMRRGFLVWARLLGVFALGCAMGRAHHRLDAWRFRTEVASYVQSGGHDHYYRVQWWPRRSGAFVFAYPDRFWAND